VHTYTFSLVAIETLGVWRREDEKILEEMRQHMAEATKEGRSKFCLTERIDVE